MSTGFLRSCELFADRAALEVEGEAWSYERLFEQAARIAATLGPANSSEVPLTAVLAHRSASAFAGILAGLLSGRGYVPLNPTFPPERTRKMLERSGCGSMIVDRRGAEQLDELLGQVGRSLTTILPDHEDVRSLAERWPKHRLIGASELEPASRWRQREVDPDSAAYLLFTSGSTGIPKGVAVTHRNIAHFIDFVVDRYAVTEEDRLTQMFDMTFDLSIFDMFVAWERGACVCCPSLQARNLPSKFINDSRVTIWFSVPSTGLLMQKLRLLRPGAFPHLRLSLFCGEALTTDLADAWALAAPNSAVENLYGPTELTLACTFYRWDAERGPREAEHGVVPIGEAFPGMRVLVADESLREVGPGEVGELLMNGPQMAPGYWNDPETTSKAFVKPPREDAVFYRTGDLVRRPAEGRPLTYLGRIDHQIKVQGYRVEIGEIEAAVREAAGVDVAVAIGWPMTGAGAEGVAVFVESAAPIEGVIEQLAERLPRYMLPSRVRALPQLPLTANGKVDRRALVRLLESE